MVRKSKNPSTEKGLDRLFRTLVKQWKRDSRYLSNSAQMALLEPYQNIIGLGAPALPLILDELRREPDHWFWALRSITREDPVPKKAAGKLDEMTQAWIDWGVENKIILP
jgi:hypothetical protein